MSQLIACQWSGGVVLVADRRVETRRDGVRDFHTVRKLFPLGPQGAVATSGAAVGIWVSRVLSRLFRRRGTLPLKELEGYALSVFQKEYDQFVVQGERWFSAHPEALRRSYVLLGGRQTGGGFGFRFHASEDHGEPYHPLATADVLTAPRRLGLESRLSRAAATRTDGGREILELAVAGMRRIAGQDDAVAGPFDTVTLSAGGVRWEIFDEPAPPPRAHILGG